MKSYLLALGVCIASVCTACQSAAAKEVMDPRQLEERTCFQVELKYADNINLCSDVAIVYGIDRGLPNRIKTWRDRGYRIHVMTGISWGNYQDYMYGRFDGVNHENEAQTDKAGNKIGHGRDVYYMSPGENYGKYICIGVKRALDAGAEAIHLEEPEFWVRGGYSEGFKKEWKSYYGTDWVAPDSSEDAEWKSSRLKYYLYRRALQQVFDFVQAYNVEHGKDVKCYVPTHSLLNYAHWRIVSPESSLARLTGCDGYIGQVWTGTSRTPNMYNGEFKERTFETAFLEYSSMYNLVRSTERRVWYLNDPVEDNPTHDWEDYRMNWESTLTASLLQPEVWRYEVMPWPGRVFTGRFPGNVPEEQRQGIPAPYATELQVVVSALNDMKQADWSWDNKSDRVGQFVSDSLMFQRGEKGSSDANMGHVYGMALPLLKRGIPVDMVQLENVGIEDYLRDYRLLFLSYSGMKPLSPEVHSPIAAWVKKGGVLVIVDDDLDSFNAVQEWWNIAKAGEEVYGTPRQHLMETLGLKRDVKPGFYKVGKGWVCYERKAPSEITATADGDESFMKLVHAAADKRHIQIEEKSCLALRRGAYFIAAGLDESVKGAPWGVDGRFINLFDPELKLLRSVDFVPGSRYFLLNLDKAQANADVPLILAAGCKALPVATEQDKELHGTFTIQVSGVANTKGILLCSMPNPVQSITLDGEAVTDYTEQVIARLLWVRFPNQAKAFELKIKY